MKILYKLASRWRKNKFFATLDNIIAMAKHDDYIILCSLDIDDETMNDPETRGRIEAYGEKVKAYWGFSGSKIVAINREICFIDDWQILINVSDDQVFTKEGFDLDIIEHFKNFSGLLHFIDIHKPDICTMAIMDRSYYEVDGHVYHPSFLSVYSDVFQQQLAKRRKRYKFVSSPIYVHNHFRWGLSEKDAGYEITESPEMYTHDRKVRDELRKEYNLI